MRLLHNTLLLLVNSFLLLIMSTQAHALEIALSFDDAPRGDSTLLSGDERTKKLIDNLKEAEVSDALFYVTTRNLKDHTTQRIQDYIDAGFHLANHSDKHYSADKVDIETYTQDISIAHEKLASFDNVLPLYRYPYLREGNDRETRDAIRGHLKSLSYQNGYVTVDNYDWYMDKLLQDALSAGKEVDYDALRDAYITILWESILFYDNIGQEVLGRSPKHVLLLHENDLAALYIGDLVRHIETQGGKIISSQEAYQDPIATTVPDVLFNGQGRVAAIAKEKGWDESKLRDLSSDEEYLDNYFTTHEIFK